MSDLAIAIEAACPGAVQEEVEERGELTIEVSPDKLVAVAARLQGPPHGFTLLSDITCADFPDDARRFRLAYQLFSPETHARVRLRVWAGSEPRVPTVTGVWQTANWHEREVYDMFGVHFSGHPDLTRILMPEDWVGHPLRRDYPIGGEEVIFSDAV